MTTIKLSPGTCVIATPHLVLEPDRKTGSLARLDIVRGKVFTWTRFAGEVRVRDDRLRRIFDRRDLRRVQTGLEGGRLTIRKEFRGAPWRIEETYAVEGDSFAWNAAGKHRERGIPDRKAEIAEGERRRANRRQRIRVPGHAAAAGRPDREDSLREREGGGAV